MKKPDKGLAHRELAWPLSEKHCIRARRSSHDYFCPISHAGQHGLGGAAWPARPSSVQWNMGADLPASSLGLLRAAQTVKNLSALRAIQVWTLDWEDLLEKLPTPEFLPGEFHGQRSLADSSLWGRKESDTTERLTHTCGVQRMITVGRWSPNRECG